MYNKINIFTGLILIIILLSTGLIFASDKDQSSTMQKNISTGYTTYVNYTVKPGDSLYKLALKFNTTIDKIMNINNLSSSIIYIDQVLRIPYYRSDSTENNVVYNVQPGDTLYWISIRYGTTVQEIKNLNNLQSNMIYVNQKLLIPSKKANDAIGNKQNGKGTVTGMVNINNTSKRLKSQQNIMVEETTPLAVNDQEKEYMNSEVIVKYKPVVTGQAVEDFENRINLQSINSLDTNQGKIVHYKIPEGKKVEKVINQFSKSPSVEWAEPNYIYYPTAIPTDTYYSYQWDQENLNLEPAWDLEKGDKSIIIAVVDTGIIPNHPDLKDHLLPGADFVGGEKSYPVSDYSITDNNPVDETSRVDGGSHGTHVAGIIGAVTNNNKGIAGVNWNVKILPVRVLKRSGGTSWDIVEGIYYAIDQGADVINLSLGSSYKSNLQEEAIKDATSKGVVVVAAAGNDGKEGVYYPAAFKDTIAVGAVNKDNSLAYYSNYGPEVDVVAPGGSNGQSIYSTWGYYNQGDPVSGYMGMMGTSMATPHVSGIVGLLKASGVKSVAEIKDRLTGTARDLGTPGRDDKYGYGLVDAYGALLGKKLKNPKVFAAVKQNNTLNLKSEMTIINNDGSFKLENINTGNVYIIGWRDVNENGIIDKGDYYGESNTPVEIVNNGTKNVNIDMYYLPDSSENYSVNK